jgi:hypothetical protein
VALQRLPAEVLATDAGILPCKRSTEPFRRSVYVRHCAGINASGLSQLEGIGDATVDEQALGRDLSRCRVVVYGSLAGNKWLARYAKSIPALPALERRTELGPLRLIATMPNPQDPKRGVTVYAATTAAGVVGIHNLFASDNWAYVVGKDQTVLASGVYVQQDGQWILK